MNISYLKVTLASVLMTQAYPFQTRAEDNPSKVYFQDGVVFNCEPAKIDQLSADLADFLKELKIRSDHLKINRSNDGRLLNISLNTPSEDTNTLNLSERPEYALTAEQVDLPLPSHLRPGPRMVVSRKEIALALFQHGRLTEFKEKGCEIQSFKDHIGIRQNTVAWIENSRFTFPGRTSSRTNPKYWSEYSLWGNNPAEYGPVAIKGIHDVFINPHLYSMGCLFAAKVSMLHGITDFYTRIRPDPEKLIEAVNTLFNYGAPFENPEPGYVWSDFRTATPEELARTEGKYLEAVTQVAKFNFVPGDWAYFKNTDPVSSNRRGDEGSNVIYLGGNKFNNFYGLKFDKSQPPPQTYTAQQKVSIIASWGGKVSQGKIVSEALFNALMEPPDRDAEYFYIYKGGFLLTHRFVPRVF